MADTPIPPGGPNDEHSESLEDSVSIASSNSSPQADTSLETGAEDTEPAPEISSSRPNNKKGRLKKLRQSLNIYLMLLGAIVLMATAIILIAYVQSKHSSLSNGLKTQNLNQSTLNQLADSDSTVGGSQYILNVESSAIFAGQVVMRQGLQIAGNLQVGGTATFNNLAVTGTGQFSQATINNNLTVGGNSAVQGSTTIAKSLQVSGSGSFGGDLSAPQITTSNLTLIGDLILAHHIDVTGSIPSRSSGLALGNGGSVSISGSDTAGSVSIDTGDSTVAGCFVTINFTTAYGSTPHVLVTPIGAAAGGLSYYVNRSTTNFSICDASTPPSGSSFGFDYFVID